MLIIIKLKENFVKIIPSCGVISDDLQIDVKIKLDFRYYSFANEVI